GRLGERYRRQGTFRGVLHRRIAQEHRDLVGRDLLLSDQANEQGSDRTRLPLLARRLHDFHLNPSYLRTLDRSATVVPVRRPVDRSGVAAVSVQYNGLTTDRNVR